jgi:hypothetical protein
MADGSEEQKRRRGPGRPFKPGESGNPRGQKPSDPELQALAREYSVPALRKIIAIMESPASEPETVMKAAQLIIERGYGKAPVVIEQRHYEAMTEHELKQHLEEHLAVLRSYGFLRGSGGDDEEPEEPDRKKASTRTH